MKVEKFDRRDFLRGAGVAVPVALAGCTGGSSGGNGSSGSNGSGGTSGSSGTNAAGGATSSGGSGNTLNISQSLQPTTFDPILQYSDPDAQVGNRVFSKLYTYNEGTEIVPNVAESAPEVSDDNTQYTVSLRQGITFHNGDPLTAEDVKYSFDAPIEEETPLSSIFQVIDETSVVDEHTVRFNLQYPYAMFDDVLTHQIVPRSVREEDKEGFNTQNPVGSGPFRFVEWEESSHVTLERWDDYWGDPQPQVAGIRFEPITESTTRVTELQTGSQDMMDSVPPKLWSTVENMSNGGLEATNGVGYFYAAFNMNEGPTTKKKVREAIDYGFSMDSAVEQFIEPSGIRQYSPMPAPIVDDWGFSTGDWESIPNQKDIAQAEQLFSEAGVPSDWNCKIIVPPDDNRENIGVSIANGIQEAGYSANVQRLDWGTMLSQAYTGNASDYNIYVLGWVRFPDPDDFMYNLFHIDAAGTNQGVYYRNQEVMDQISQARRSLDRDERKRLYSNAITTILQDKVHLPAFSYKNSYGVSGAVNGFNVHPVSPLNPRVASEFSNVSLQ